MTGVQTCALPIYAQMIVLVWGEKGEAQVLKAIDEVLKALA